MEWEGSSMGTLMMADDTKGGIDFEVMRLKSNYQ